MLVKTDRGLEVNIPEGLYQDFRFVKAWRDVYSKDQEKSFNASLNLVSAIFADEAEEQRFLESLDDGTGRIPIDTVFSETRKLLNTLAEQEKAVKNS